MKRKILFVAALLPILICLALIKTVWSMSLILVTGLIAYDLYAARKPPPAPAKPYLKKPHHHSALR